jgi:hypothetical protein
MHSYVKIVCKVLKLLFRSRLFDLFIKIYTESDAAGNISVRLALPLIATCLSLVTTPGDEHILLDSVLQVTSNNASKKGLSRDMFLAMKKTSDPQSSPPRNGSGNHGCRCWKINSVAVVEPV